MEISDNAALGNFTIYEEKIVYEFYFIFTVPWVYFSIIINFTLFRLVLVVVYMGVRNQIQKLIFCN